MVEIGNIYYFIFVFIAVIIFFFLYFVLKNKSQKIQKNTLAIILFFNLLVHFTKLAFYPYNENFPSSIRKITFENICAVSTLIFPFIFLSKSKVLKDYMYFFGVFGGIGALFYPTEAFNKDPLEYDVIRFYICHMILVIVPVLMAIFNIHRPKYKDIWKTVLVFIGVEALILVNEVILIETGIVEEYPLTYFNINGRNSSLIFGPNEHFKGISKIIMIFVPSIFIIDRTFIPIIWMIIPIWIYIPIACVLVGLPWNIKTRKSRNEE